MHNEKGMTLAELLVALALATAVLVVATTFSIPMLARETMRSSVYDVQMTMQVARVEAVTRNRNTRFDLNRAQRWVRVIDLETGEELHRRQLPSAVSFARPDAGQAVTLPPAGPVMHQVTFFADGTVNNGGDVCLHGGNDYRKLSLYGAGGVQIERWTGSKWVSGS